jgi:SAM-dependent methyltransferase
MKLEPDKSAASNLSFGSVPCLDIQGKPGIPIDAEGMKTTRRASMKLKDRFEGCPFGSEYSESSRWGFLERLYIRFFGTVDLPSRIRARVIANALRNIPWKTMIDYGCGTGSYSFYFSRSRGVRVRGLDIDHSRISDCIAISRKLQRESLDFVRSSSIFKSGEFQPGSADVVLSVEVLECLPDTQAAFREIQQVLKPGGYLVGHVPYERSGDAAMFNNERLEAYIREAGLVPVSMTRVYGRAASFLCQIFSRCIHSRLLTAIAFPLLLLASLACGGKNSRGSFCVVVAQKQ